MTTPQADAILKQLPLTDAQRAKHLSVMIADGAVERDNTRGEELAEEILRLSDDGHGFYIVCYGKQLLYMIEWRQPQDYILVRLKNMRSALAPHLDSIAAESMKRERERCRSVAQGYVMGPGPEGQCAQAIADQIIEGR